MADNGSSRPTRDVDDISLDDAGPSRRPRRGSAVGVIIVIIVVLGVIVGIAVNQDKARKAKEEADRQAAISRQAQLDQIKATLQSGYDLAAAGDLEGAIDKLGVADAQLGNIVSAANADNNQEVATQVLAQKSAVASALSALKAKQDELKALAMEQFSGIAGQFGLSTPAAPAAAPADGTAAPADGSAPPATGAETPAPVEPGASMPAPGPSSPVPPTAPAEPVAPAAPGAPVSPTAPMAPPAPAAPAAPPAS